MSTFQVNYDAVNSEVRILQSHLYSNLINLVNNGHRQIQSSLRQVDGATRANYQRVMDENRNKMMAAASVLERLLSFMSNSSRQIQASENQIARAFNGSRR